MAYQDAWIRGETKSGGDRACADRYALVRDVVAHYTRPVTVWDLGANLGYFGCRLADEFGAVSVMVERRPVLVDICQENRIPTTIAMTRRIAVGELEELAGCEHADVVLAMSVLHHFADWKRALAAVVALGETVVIETPGRGDRGSANYPQTEALLDVIESMGAESIGWSPSHVTPGVKRPMVVIRRKKSSLVAGYCYRERVRARGAHRPRAHTITSTPSAKTIAFADGESRAWVPGMNLWNWAQLGGSYPSRLSVASALTDAAARLTSHHGDVRPWNAILQGERVELIDAGHRTRRDDATALRESVGWIARPEVAYVVAR